MHKSKREDTILWESLKHHYALWHFIRYKTAADIITDEKGEKLLDVGSGIELLDFLIMNKKIICVDLARNNIKEAIRIRKDDGLQNTLDPLVADLFALPLKGDFDWVICSEVLEHVVDDKKALIALASVLKQGGHLLITVPNLLRLEFPQMFRFSLRPKNLYPGHLREYRADDISGFLRSSPLKVEKIMGVYLDFPFFHILDLPSRAFMRIRPSLKLRFIVYRAFYRIYASFWKRFERLFWHHAYYILVILKKPF